MRALTPARLLLHPDRYPWFTSLCFRTFRLHPLNNAPVAAMLCYRPRLGPRFALAAIGGASDFVQSQQSHQSYSAVSSSYRESPLDSSVYGLSIHFQLLSTSPRGDAVTFSYWRLAPPERDFHPLALAAPKRTRPGAFTRRPHLVHNETCCLDKARGANRQSLWLTTEIK